MRDLLAQSSKYRLQLGTPDPPRELPLHHMSSHLEHDEKVAAISRFPHAWGKLAQQLATWIQGEIDRPKAPLAQVKSTSAKDFWSLSANRFLQMHNK